MCKKADEDKANLVDHKRQWREYIQGRVLEAQRERLANRQRWQPPRAAPTPRRYRNRPINF